MIEILSMGIPLWVIVLYLGFMAAVQGMPRPKEAAATWYVWLYGSLHWLSTNWKLALNPRNFPSAKRLLDRPWNKDE